QPGQSILCADPGDAFPVGEDGVDRTGGQTVTGGITLYAAGVCAELAGAAAGGEPYIFPFIQEDMVGGRRGIEGGRCGGAGKARSKRRIKIQSFIGSQPAAVIAEEDPAYRRPLPQHTGIGPGVVPKMITGYAAAVADEQLVVFGEGQGADLLV